MKLHRLQRRQHLPVSADAAWRFFSSPLNLPYITPGWLNLTPVGPLPERMFAGMMIRYRLTPLLGIPVTWISEITHVDEPHFFVDEQRFGPYRFWHHQHHFRPFNGGVEMIDTVSYGLKYSIVGTAMHALLIRRRLEEIFNFRQQTLAQYFSHPAGRSARVQERHP